jgi:hypothetical protein
MFTLWTEYGDKDSTLSQLYYNGDFLCYILEDEVRPMPYKVHSDTAIWGNFIYELTLEDSGKFGPDTPTIKDVPLFQYIRMHGGTDESHTEGCPLYGRQWDKDNFRLHDREGIKTELQAIIGNGKPSYVTVSRFKGEGVT